MKGDEWSKRDTIMKYVVLLYVLLANITLLILVLILGEMRQILHDNWLPKEEEERRKTALYTKKVLNHWHY